MMKWFKHMASHNSGEGFATVETVRVFFGDSKTQDSLVVSKSHPLFRCQYFQMLSNFNAASKTDPTTDSKAEESHELPTIPKRDWNLITELYEVRAKSDSPPKVSWEFGEDHQIISLTFGETVYPLTEGDFESLIETFAFLGEKEIYSLLMPPLIEIANAGAKNWVKAGKDGEYETHFLANFVTRINVEDHAIARLWKDTFDCFRSVTTIVCNTPNLSFFTHPDFLSKDLHETLTFELNLAGNDLKDLVVPESLKGIKALNLKGAKNVPLALIQKALEAGVEHLDLEGQDLKDLVVPESLKGIKTLNLSGAKNVPVALIQKALEAGVEHLDLTSVLNVQDLVLPEKLNGLKWLSLCDTGAKLEFVQKAFDAGLESLNLEDLWIGQGGVNSDPDALRRLVVTEESVANLKVMNLKNVKLIPAYVVSVLLHSEVRSLDLTHISLVGVVIPFRLKCYDFLSLNKPLTENPMSSERKRLVQRAFEAKVRHISLQKCKITTIPVPKSFTGIQTIVLSDLGHVPKGFVSKAEEDGVSFAGSIVNDIRRAKEREEAAARQQQRNCSVM